MSNTYEVLCVAEAASPITHMSGSSGNESLVAREPVVTDRGVALVPCLSGNAIRHRFVREPGFRWLVDAYGLRGGLTLQQLNFLFHGGALTKGGGREDTRRIAEMQRLFPLVRLIGGCLPDQILAGSLNVWRGTLVCRENASYLKAVLPSEAMPDGVLRSSESFVSGYQYTRGDAAKSKIDLGPIMPEGTEVDSNLMIFAGQAVLRGAAFIHGFTLPHVSEIELGALLWSLQLWQKAGGTIGGQAARGHGRLKLSLLDFGGDVDALTTAYRDYALSVKDDAIEWLTAAFEAKPEKPKKGKKEAA